MLAQARCVECRFTSVSMSARPCPRPHVRCHVPKQALTAADECVGAALASIPEDVLRRGVPALQDLAASFEPVRALDTRARFSPVAYRLYLRLWLGVGAISYF